MIDLTLLGSPTAGQVIPVKALPARIGRASTADVQITGPGVWDEHFELRRTPDFRIALVVLGDARVAVDSAPVREAILAGGSLLDVGGVTLRFALSAAAQQPQRFREAVVWTGAVLLLAVQGLLIWWTGR